MNVESMKQMIAQGQFNLLESAWMEAMEEKLPVAEMAGVLETLVKRGKGELALTLSGLMIEQGLAELPPPAALEQARALALAVPASDQLRLTAADLYKKVYADHPNFEAIFTAAGLLNGQSPRRALRTLEVCLAVREGTYLANKFDHRVFVARKYNEVFGEFEIADADGRVSRFDPKALADEFEIVEATDFRVLTQHRCDELKALLRTDPAAIMIGICMASGGSIDSDALKDRLVPRLIAAEAWSGWWSKARSAAKRSTQLSIEGRSPVTITYHATGRTLEEEFSDAARKARTPLAHLDVLKAYVREARDRRTPMQETFTTPTMTMLADHAVNYQHSRGADALAAALAFGAATALGIKAPVACPTPADVMLNLAKPAEAIAHLHNEDLWPAALEAMNQRPDAAPHLAALMKLSPASMLDMISQRLLAAGQADAIEQAAAAAYGDPLGHLELFVWLWKGPANAPANLPSRVELLSRLLKALTDLEHDWDVKPAHRKAIYQRVRSVLSASDYAGYRQAVAAMDIAIAETVKRLIERAQGALADSVQDTMMNALRENFYSLFAQREKLPPWLDENVIWSGEAALLHRQAEFTELSDVKMLENARAIGAAAEHGDLSENADWKFALEERDMLRARAAKLQDELSRAKAIHPADVPTESVGVGSRVTLRRASDNAEIILSFLGPWESDLANRVYNYQTPLARELMGKTIGETITMEFEGQSDQFLIEALGSAVQ